MFGQKRYEETNQLLNEHFREKKALVAVHRGSWGGNIVENTIPSCALALEMGGDIFECDVVSSTDGTFYAFHDGTEPRSLNCSKNIKTMSSQEIDALTYSNSIGHNSGVHVERMKNVFEHFSNRELMNIDRAWDIFPELVEFMGRYPHLKQQAILKGPVKKETLDFLNDCPHKYMYMPIVYSLEEIEAVLSYPDINTVGMELIASSEEHDLFSDDTISYLHSKNIFCWANVIKLDVDVSHTLYAGYDDDLALLNHPDASWGVLLKKNIDVLQTDWPLQLAIYRNRFFSIQTMK